MKFTTKVLGALLAIFLAVGVFDGGLIRSPSRDEVSALLIAGNIFTLAFIAFFAYVGLRNPDKRFVEFTYKLWSLAAVISLVCELVVGIIIDF